MRNYVNYVKERTEVANVKLQGESEAELLLQRQIARARPNRDCVGTFLLNPGLRSDIPVNPTVSFICYLLGA